MSGPQYVPIVPAQVVRSYESPPRRPESWVPDRPGEVVDEGGQPRGMQLGNQGPDQGYVYNLLPLFDDKLHLAEGESRADVDAGVITVALKRASLFGRAPMIHDLTVGYAVWGFLDATPAPELLKGRLARFAGVAHGHHYVERRAVADAVPVATLRRTHAAVLADHAKDWASLLHLDPEPVDPEAGED